MGLLLLLLAVPARAADTYGDVEISQGAAPVGNNAHGYTEYRFRVRNKGGQARSVRITLPADSGSGRGVLASVSREITVGPGLEAPLSVCYPAQPSVSGANAIVAIDGARQERILGLALVSGRGSHGGGWGRRGGWRGHHMKGGPMDNALVLHSQQVPDDFFQRADAAGRVHFGQRVRSTEPVSGWSDNWLAYSRYDGIAVAARDLAGLATESPRTQAVLHALWRYAETGGVLLVVGPGDIHLPPTWKRGSRPADGMNVYQAGFGQVLHHQESDPAKWEEDHWARASSAFHATAQPWQRGQGLRELQDSFPVVDGLGVPVRGLFILMVVFAIAIGPLNIWLLTRWKRRIWLLWTAPAISAATCALVLAYTVLGEGWSGHARLGSVTLLDQPGQRAATLARSAYYSPLTPGGGLRYPEDTEVQAMGEGHPALHGHCAMEWKGEQLLTRGWVAARIPSHFALRRSEATVKLRLDLHRNGDGTLSVVNQLGADIRSLTVADERGDLYSGGPVVAGAEATLRRAGNARAEGDPTKGWRGIYAAGDWSMKEAGSLRAAEFLTPSSYLAVLEQTPFLEPGLRGTVRRPSPAVVIGLYSALGEGK